jgi:metal-sulfur cluster biosynthetic enzyme/ferredoxin
VKSAYKDNLRIEIDRDLCIGAASCSIIAPQTFILDDQGKVDFTDGEFDDKDTITMAAESCPVRAITLIEESPDGTKQGSVSRDRQDHQKVTISEDSIWSALKSVLDPELAINVVDLGLVYGVHLHGSAVVVDLTLTTPGCPLIAEFTQSAKQAILQVAGVTDVAINLTFDPPWNPTKMSEEAKMELGLFI